MSRKRKGDEVNMAHWLVLWLIFLVVCCGADECTSNYHTQSSCFSNRTCDWDIECYQLPATCAARYAMSACYRDGLCVWNNQLATCENRLQTTYSTFCLLVTAPLECNNQTHCEFDTQMRLCSEKRTSVCNQTAACTRTAGCKLTRDGTCVNAYANLDIFQYVCQSSTEHPFAVIPVQSQLECTQKKGCLYASVPHSLFNCNARLPDVNPVPVVAPNGLSRRTNNEISDAGITTSTIIVLSLIFVAFCLSVAVYKPDRVQHTDASYHLHLKEKKTVLI